MDVFIGRQPIFNMNEEIVAYELLYRSQTENAIQNTDSDTATVDVLVNYFLSMGIKEVTKGKPGFVNFTENLLMDDLLGFINPSKIVVEILENVPITEQLIQRVKELKELDFKFALDDFVLDHDVLLYDELFQYIDYIKVDFLATPLLERMKIENRVKNNYPHIKLLAEKVETRNQYEVAKFAGYTLFQGYFFEQPQVIIATDIPLNTLQYFKILLLMREDEPDITRIAESIERDISLTFKLLKLMNESEGRRKSKVRSIKQAVMLIGLTELRKFIYLLALREGLSEDSDLYKELLRTSLFRAKVCEKLAKMHHKENFSEYFLVGMFSLIDTLLKRPIETILDMLPFSEEVASTIRGVRTSMSPYLKFSIALDKMNFTQMDQYAEQLNLTKSDIASLYQEASDWSEETIF